MKALFLAALLAAPLRAAEPFKAGVDALLESGAKSLRGKRVALITHPAAVTASLEMTADALFKTEGVTLAALMGPEHGIRGAAYAGEKVQDERDPKTGVPVYSLYGKTAKPTPAMLKGVDALVYDVQDIGARSYTYISTLALAMEAAVEAKIPLIVLDRPDPTGGDRVEGGLPPAGWTKNFINFLPVPYVYGMTPGELALMINGEGWLPGKKKCKLEIVKLSGWRRGMLFSQTGRPWVPTSPHILRAETSLFYAATGIVGELGVLNEGVGYPLPFELLGAPWLDGEKLAAALNALMLPGLAFRPLSYKPYYGTHKGRLCGGVQIHLLDARAAPWTAVQFHAVEAIGKLYPERDLFAAASTSGFDRCLGSTAVREHLQARKPVAELLARWEEESAAFSKRRAKYLLYD